MARGGRRWPRGSRARAMRSAYRRQGSGRRHAGSCRSARLPGSISSSISRLDHPSEPAAPGMLLRTGFGMGAQEVMQHVQKREHVVAVATRLARADIVDDHVPDLVGAMLLARQI